jgi:uncharacterized protein (DUF433 family)
MQLEDYLDIHGPDDIRLKGHRLGLEHIVERYREGYSPEQIALEFPGLSLEQVYGVITYYLHHQQEVDDYITRLRTWQEARYQEALAHPDPVMQRIRTLREQMMYR